MSDRTPQIVGFEGDIGLAIAGKTVGVAGGGAVGGKVAEFVASMGPKGVVIVDCDVYEEANIATQGINTGDVGQPKATCIAERLKSRYPSVDVRAHHGRIEDLPFDTFVGCAIVIASFDNIAAEMEISRRCMMLGIALVIASVSGEAMAAQVRCYSNRDADSPCVACGLSDVEWQHVDRETQFSCDGVATVNTMPTRSFTALSSMAASMGVITVLRHLFGIGVPAADTFAHFDGLMTETARMQLRRNANCAEEHTNWKRMQLEAVGDQSLRSIVTAAGFHNGDIASVTVGEHDFLGRAVCDCETRRPFERFVNGATPLGECDICGATRIADPSSRVRRVPISEIKHLAERRLGDLAEVPARYVIVHGRERSALVRERSES